jgi:tetratricopeptide (TPR) repeat protein
LPAVTLDALRPTPSKAAQRDLQTAAGLVARGDYAKALDKLQNLVRRNPAFAEACINLGVQLIRLNHYQPALAEFQQARLLGVNDAALHTNLACAWLGLQRVAEAEKAVDLAIASDNAYAPAHLVRGHLTLKTGGDLRDAETSFRQASALPMARVLLAQVLQRLGRHTEAASELAAYLATGDTAHRDLALALREDGTAASSPVVPAF